MTFDSCIYSNHVFYLNLTLTLPRENGYHISSDETNGLAPVRVTATIEEEPEPGRSRATYPWTLAQIAPLLEFRGRRLKSIGTRE